MIRKICKPIYDRLPRNLKGQAVAVYKYLSFLPKNLLGLAAGLFLSGGKIKNLSLFERSFHSQNGEDGIISIIFKKIGVTNRFCVEFGVHPFVGNTVRLKNKGWDCLHMDGSGDGQSIKREFITAENINGLFAKYGVPQEFDLLSIDIDSNDYWAWKAIEDYHPRVVIMEYNASVPPDQSKSVAYDPNLTWDKTDYFGASLLALQRLGESKGYSLVGCDSRGVNAFFILKELVEEKFIPMSAAEAYRPPRYGKMVNGKHIGHPHGTREMIDV